MFGLGKQKEKKERKNKIKFGKFADILVLVLIPFMAVNKDYPLVPVSLIFVFCLMMIKRIVVYQTSLKICKRCREEMLGKEILELEKEEDEKQK